MLSRGQKESLRKVGLIAAIVLGMVLLVQNTPPVSLQF